MAHLGHLILTLYNYIHHIQGSPNVPKLSFRAAIFLFVLSVKDAVLHLIVISLYSFNLAVFSGFYKIDFICLFLSIGFLMVNYKLNTSG